MDLDAETYAIIEANTQAGIRINSYGPPDPGKEDVMSLENVVAQRVKIAALLERLKARREASSN